VSDDSNDIIRMAREAGYGEAMSDLHSPALTRFAALVAAAEREACAKTAGEFAQKWWSIHCASNKHMETTRKAHDDFCALQTAIRARGEK
jgi:hypothetical protein